MESDSSVHLGNWIIGDTPDNSVVPTTGTATYTGHAVGTVVTRAKNGIIEKGDNVTSKL